MPTKKQHFVPRVYMKAWETQVETLKEPEKKFNGIYVIKDGSIGDGANRNSVLWKPHLYTINFKYSFICNSCAKVKSQYVDLIYDLLKTGFKQPVYGKLGYSIIKTKKSINKHFFEIHDWDFYYYDGNVAKKAAILSQIDALNCYILEDSELYAVAVGAGAWVCNKVKNHEPKVVTEFRASLKSYIDAIRKGEMDIDKINNLMSSLEALKADKNYSKISIQLTSEELDVLVGRIYEYTLKLASDNEIEIAADDFEEEKDVIKNLQSYLKVQRRIFAEAA